MMLFSYLEFVGLSAYMLAQSLMPTVPDELSNSKVRPLPSHHGIEIVWGHDLAVICDS